ncbi:UNVERIFIED_CONTAM: hypothetical protein GTU68_041062 [Idotea baltica]|nr:hypothetical protein [Idotea baltica]
MNIRNTISIIMKTIITAMTLDTRNPETDTTQKDPILFFFLTDVYRT